MGRSKCRVQKYYNKENKQTNGKKTKFLYYFSKVKYKQVEVSHSQVGTSLSTPERTTMRTRWRERHDETLKTL